MTGSEWPVVIELHQREWLALIIGMISGCARLVNVVAQNDWPVINGYGLQTVESNYGGIYVPQRAEDARYLLLQRRRNSSGRLGRKLWRILLEAHRNVRMRGLPADLVFLAPENS